MSFPTIPDITPDIDICIDDAVNLLLSSIAMEEISLSKLIDAERDKISCVLSGGNTPCDLLKINKSVDGTIKDIIKLQMLLQFKLENVCELMPCTTTTCSTTTSTTTTSSSTSASSTTAEPCSGCSLIGDAKGCAANQCSGLPDQTATLHVFVLSTDRKNSTVKYATENGAVRFYASGSGGIQSVCCQCSSGETAIFGRGKLICRRRNTESSVDALFSLTVRETGDNQMEFRIKITSVADTNCCYDSGFVRVKRDISNIRMNIC